MHNSAPAGNNIDGIKYSKVKKAVKIHSSKWLKGLHDNGNQHPLSSSINNHPKERTKPASNQRERSSKRVSVSNTIRCTLALNLACVHKSIPINAQIVKQTDSHITYYLRMSIEGTLNLEISDTQPARFFDTCFSNLEIEE